MIRINGVLRVALREFFLKTTTGRMLLFTGFLAILAFLVPYGCEWKGKRGAQSTAGEAPPKGAFAEGDLPPTPKGIGETLILGQKYDALISRYGGDLASTKTELDVTRKELENLRATIKDEHSAQDKERKQLGDTLRLLKEGLAREAGQPLRQDLAAPTPQGMSGAGGGVNAIRALELGTPAPKEKKAPDRSVRIPTGASGRATLLNGVFAPVTGEPSPVRLRFDAALLGPNRARVSLGTAFLIGKASGDPNACRVSIQIEKISTVKENGEAIETKALGYVVGEDGLEGVPGSYEWRAWEYVPLAVGVGGLQGLSGAFAQTQTTTTLSPLGGATSVITGDAMKLAGAQAAAGASQKLSEIVAERMKEIRPAVSTSANRTVTVVFLDGVTLEGLSTHEIDNGKENDPFRGLDAHR